MKLAIIGSRNLEIINISKYVPPETCEIISGGAKGIDTLAKNYALTHKLKYTEFKPDYKRYGKAAPLKRNLQIINYAEKVVAIWDGKSRGTKFVIDNCKNKEIKVYII